MLRRVSALRDLTIQGIDGDVGFVDDVYLEDRTWVSRYLLMDTGYWRKNRRILVSPFAVTGIDWYHGRVSVELTRSHLRDSPDINIDRPVSRQQEAAYLAYYGYPCYWNGSQAWGDWPHPSTRVPRSRRSRDTAVHDRHMTSNDSRLRSGNAVYGYQVESADGVIGHITDLVQDELSWSVRYLVVDTQPWLPGRRVLISTHWLEAVSWNLGAVFVGLDREAIRSSPTWQEEDLLTADHEQALFEHYGQPRRAAPPGHGEPR